MTLTEIYLKATNPACFECPLLQLPNDSNRSESSHPSLATERPLTLHLDHLHCRVRKDVCWRAVATLPLMLLIRELSCSVLRRSLPMDRSSLQ